MELHRIMRVAKACEKALSQQFGLSWTGYQIIEVADTDPNHQISTFAESCGVAYSTLTSVVDRLVRDGWVDRSHKEGDRRTYQLNLLRREEFLQAQALVNAVTLEMPAQVEDYLHDVAHHFDGKALAKVG